MSKTRRQRRTERLLAGFDAGAEQLSRQFEEVRAPLTEVFPDDPTIPEAFEQYEAALTRLRVVVRRAVLALPDDTETSLQPRRRRRPNLKRKRK